MQEESVGVGDEWWEAGCFAGFLGDAGGFLLREGGTGAALFGGVGGGSEEFVEFA